VSTDFAGFPVEGLDFYDDLEVDNTRTFWTANKQVYLDAVRTPMLALLDRLEPEFGPGKVFRPYRDLRYSHDPTPYKTHQGGYVAIGPATGWYVQVDAGGVRVSAGCFHSERESLARFRAAVDDDDSGTALERLVRRLARKGLEIGGDRLKTRPRGYPADHPRIDLLRHRSLHAGRSYGSPAWVHTGELADRVCADWRTLAPLVEWAREHIGGPTADDE